jgi:hypothetical protein
VAGVADTAVGGAAVAADAVATVVAVDGAAIAAVTEAIAAIAGKRAVSTEQGGAILQGAKTPLKKF